LAVVLLWERHQEVMGRGSFCGGVHLCVGGVGAAKADVF
jgi:hypothetical protein